MYKAQIILTTCVCIVMYNIECQTVTPTSPCPSLFDYEPSSGEAGKWYGHVLLSTDTILHGLWLNIILDRKADILGNWVGYVTTNDNIDFKIENTSMKIIPGPAQSVRFFVQYNQLSPPPRLTAIRLNGREICSIDNPTPPLNRPLQNNYESNSYNNGDSYIRPTAEVSRRPVYVPTEPPRNEANANPFSINGGSSDVNTHTIGTQTKMPPGSKPNGSTHSKRPTSVTSQSTGTDYHQQGYESDDHPDDEYKRPSEDDYFTGDFRPSGGRPSSTTKRPNRNDECGKVMVNAAPLVVYGRPTVAGQWPWHIALYQTQTVDSKYICGGTLVSRHHVITAAHCVTRKSSSRVVNKNTLTVYLGKHNLRTSTDGVQVKFVGNIMVHPNYNGTSYYRDMSVLWLTSSVEYTDYVRPACLWPDDKTDLKYIIGKKGTVVGWGFDETGVVTEDLTLAEMPVVEQQTCIWSYSEFYSRFTNEYTFCAGFLNGTSVCNGDSGGGMVFSMDGIWYLRGLVSISVAQLNEFKCDPNHYVVFTDLARALPWIKQSMKAKNND